mmetsp:Transcript_57419/g.151130  ORF Transcript_57419/g.151130 Transcript_57419/m.151130 type:complete len:213 (+) Transcript_57419:394-1032(+)
MSAVCLSRPAAYSRISSSCCEALSWLSWWKRTLPSRCHSAKVAASRVLSSDFSFFARMNFEYSSIALLWLSLCAWASTALSHSKCQAFQASMRTIFSFLHPNDASTFAWVALRRSDTSCFCLAISSRATSRSRWLSASATSPCAAVLQPENTMAVKVPEVLPAISDAYLTMRLSPCESTLSSFDWSLSSSASCAERCFSCSLSASTSLVQFV